MAVNFGLVNAYSIDPGQDPLERSWVGWDPAADDWELWAVNRGRWRLDDRMLAQERFATLSYQGLAPAVR